MTALDIITALGLILVLEGLVYAIWPEGMKRAIVAILRFPAQQLRVAGVVAATIGVVVLWLMYG